MIAVLLSNCQARNVSDLSTISAYFGSSEKCEFVFCAPFHWKMTLEQLGRASLMSDQVPFLCDMNIDHG